MVDLGRHLGRGSVSLLITSHNHVRFVGDAIDAALSQTEPADEVIILDDASTDGSADVVAKYGDRATVVVNPANEGALASRDRLAEMSAGDYVAYLDSDDVVAPEFVAATRGALDEDTTAGIVYTDMRVFGPQAMLWAELQPSTPEPLGDGFRWRAGPPDEASIEGLEHDRNFMHGSSLLRRSALIESGGYASSRVPLADLDLYRRMIGRGWQPVYVPEALLHYRRHAGGQATDPLLVSGAADLLEMRRLAIEKTNTELAVVREQLSLVAGELAAVRSTRWWRLRASAEPLMSKVRRRRGPVDGAE